MNHPAELSIHSYLVNATKGESSMSEDTIQQVGAEVMEAMRKQFGGGNKRDGFRLRMSNIGRPTCQLWFEKNKPETALPKPTTFVMNMLIGDIVEAAFKGILKEAGVSYRDAEHVTLELDKTKVNGTYDLVIDGAVDDVKSASDWSYRNKFESFDTLKSSDPFGYVGQLAGYAKASGTKAGGWWVVNKANGNIKYVPADTLDMEEEITTLNKTVDTVESNAFKRCFSPVPETFRGKATGNTILNDSCKFCDYRFSCFEGLTETESRVSQAKNKPTVAYID